MEKTDINIKAKRRARFADMHGFLRNSLTAIIAFIVVSLVQFCVFFTNFGPLTGPDPEMSIAGSYALTTGQSFNETESEPQEIAGNVATSHVQKIKMPENLNFNDEIYNKDLITTLLTKQVQTAPGTITIASDDKLKLQRDALTNQDSSKTEVETYTRANQYTPITYVPTALGMKVAEMLDKSSWGILQSARISNFIIYLILAIASILIAPRAKGLFATIAALPPAIFCAASMSVDAALIGVSLVYVAWATKIYNDCKRLSIPKMVGVGTLTCLLLIVKAPYVPLALLYLAIPKLIWPLKSKLITVAATLFAFGAIYGTWTANFQMIYIIPAIDYASQIASVLGNLPSSLATCLANAIFYTAITTPTSLLYLVLPVLIAIIVVGKKLELADWTRVVLVISIILISATLVYLFLMLTWNELTGLMQNLSGFQERYLLPLLPTLAFIFVDKKRNEE